MCHHQRNELYKPEEDNQDSRENLDLVAVQLLGPEELEEEEAISPSSSVSSSLSGLFQNSLEEAAAAETSSPPHSPQSACLPPSAMAAPPCIQPEDEGSSSPDKEGASSREGSEEAESSLQGTLRLKKACLVAFLLLKYRTREPTTKAEMLSSVIKEHQDYFPEIFSTASGLWHLCEGSGPQWPHLCPVTTLGLSYDGMVCDEPTFPNTGLLFTVLWVIASEGDCAPEEEVWKAQQVRCLLDGKEHWIYGMPRELLTNVWVQKKYLEYRQVPNSNPASYQFLWGPRAHAETTKLNVLEFLLGDYRRDPSSGPSLFEEVLSDEEGHA